VSADLTVVCTGRRDDKHARRVLRRLADERSAGGTFRALPETGTYNQLPGRRKGDPIDAHALEEIKWGRPRFVCPCGLDVPVSHERLGKIVDGYGVAPVEMDISALASL